MPAAASAGSGSAGAGAKQVRVRMYNVGFGDCLLFFLPTDMGERTMLVDCGAHMSGAANPMSAITKDLVASVSTDGRARIDVVVATHRHFDHISGFDMKIWNEVEVGEVWMPWTEERGNARADALRTSQQRLAAALAARFPSAADPVGWLALNSFSNAGAEHTLLKGFAGTPHHRFLPDPDRDKRSFTTPLLTGITVHALGPSHDLAIVATLEPPKGKYFPEPAKAAARGRSDGAAPTNAALAAVFSDRHRVTPADYARRYPSLAGNADTRELQRRAEADYMGAAAALEDAINGTSLVLALEIGDACLLLAGDAEWGTWSEVLADRAWTELLTRTVLYKVSHHGSLNGTPKPFVDDLLPNDAVSLMSFRPVAKWPSIPRETLVAALGQGKRTLFRTDAMPAPSPTVTRNGNLWVEITVPLQ